MQELSFGKKIEDHKLTCLGIIVEQRYLNDYYPLCLVKACAKQGIKTQVIIAETIDGFMQNNRIYADIYIHRNHTKAGLLYLAQISHHAITVNPVESVLRCQNKILMYHRLLNNQSLNIPRTFFNVHDLIDDNVNWPIIAKPINGNNSEGIFIFNNYHEISNNLDFPPNYIMQEYITNENYDIKLYYIDGKVYAVRKPSKLHPDKDVLVQVIDVKDEFYEIVCECQKLFQLNLFGVDLIQGIDGQYYVIEVNECCGFSAVPAIEANVLACVKHIFSSLTRGNNAII